MAAIDEIKAFASLTSGLLARKGAARPAMRPQLLPTSALATVPVDDELAAAQEELGWNDSGVDEDGDTQAAEMPDVLVRREELAASLADNRAKPARAMAPANRRAAFTLRVDHERHLRLRLACTLQNRSAQQVVTEALDRLLDEMPGLDDLASRARRH